jgi:hypothetical protein
MGKKNRIFRGDSFMVRKINRVIVIIICILFVLLLFFHVTPELSIRSHLFAKGFDYAAMHSKISQAKDEAPDVYKVYDPQPKDLTNHEPYNYWEVKKYGILYFTDYYGE